MYKNVVIPLENSATDEAILAHIRPLARLTGAKLWLVHVADGHVARNRDQLNLADSEEMVGDRAYLGQRRDELSREGFAVEMVLRCGDPTKEILAIAEKIPADLIAMSTHGHGVLMDVLLGSVASEVRHRTDIPVLLVRARRA